MTEKPKIYRYDVPGEPEFHPATFVGAGTAILSDDGFFSACTDYGNYAFDWKLYKEKYCFRSVFNKFDDHYILEKIARKDHFDLEKGIAALKAEGRKVPEELEHISTEHEFQTMPCPENFDGDDFEMFYDYSPSARAFVESFVPRLQLMMQADLERQTDWITPVPTFASPLRYPGGKQRALDAIKALFPRKPVYEYREPFVGGGSVFCMARNENIAERYWINDKFADLIAFYQTCQDAQLCRDLRWELRRWHRELGEDAEAIRTKFEFIKKELGRDLAPYNRAKYFFFLNRVTFSGTIQAGGFSEDSAVKRFTVSSINRLKLLPQALDGVLITNDDFEAVIEARTDGQDVFMFLDPPYKSVEKSKLYGPGGELHDFDHERLAHCLKKSPHKFLMTYDDSPEIRKLYKGIGKVTRFNLQYGMNNCRKDKTSKTGDELFIRNYE